MLAGWVWCGVGVNYGGWGCVCYRCMGAGVIGTYIGVAAVATAQDRDRRRALVNAVMNFWVP